MAVNPAGARCPCFGESRGSHLQNEGKYRAKAMRADLISGAQGVLYWFEERNSERFGIALQRTMAT
jgi:hypothetical protein